MHIMCFKAEALLDHSAGQGSAGQGIPATFTLKETLINIFRRWAITSLFTIQKTISSCSPCRPRLIRELATGRQWSSGRADRAQSSPEIMRVKSAVTFGPVAMPNTGYTVVAPLAARPM
jgi:hypothetical protein